MEKALIAAIAYFICYGGNWLFGQCMIERPIVTGAITGLLLGDLQTGLIVGATLEAIFMGAVNIGGQISAEPCAATVFAVTFASSQTASVDALLAIAVPIGILSAFVSMFINNIAFNFFVPLIDKYAAKGNVKALIGLNFGCWFLRFFIFSTLMFIAVFFGESPVQAFIDSIPAVIMSGLTAAGQLLPAVGFAILLKMLWSTELSLFYFAGFILVTYFNLPMIAVAAVGIIVIVLIANRDLELIKIKNTSLSSNNGQVIDEMEDFIS